MSSGGHTGPAVSPGAQGAPCGPLLCTPITARTPSLAGGRGQDTGPGSPRGPSALGVAVTWGTELCCSAGRPSRPCAGSGLPPLQGAQGLVLGCPGAGASELQPEPLPPRPLIEARFLWAPLPLWPPVPEWGRGSPWPLSLRSWRGILALGMDLKYLPIPDLKWGHHI